jgi:hypothetical protein
LIQSWCAVKVLPQSFRANLAGVICAEDPLMAFSHRHWVLPESL